jgi:hypothetical protein
MTLVRVTSSVQASLLPMPAQLELTPLTRLLEQAFHGQARALASQLDLLPRQLHLITAAIIGPSVDAEFVLLNVPFARRLASHRVGHERAHALKDIGPMTAPDADAARKRAKAAAVVSATPLAFMIRIGPTASLLTRAASV